jgi:serine/threonine protein kinase
LIVLKAFDRRKALGRDFTQMFVREVESLIHLSHPCVVAIVGYSLATRTAPAQIGTRYAANGSLRDALAKSVRFLDDTGKAIVVCGIVIGMAFIHSRGVLHRDLKPENILLDERGFAQIGDLGTSRFWDPGLTLTAQVGTPLYMAPEMYADPCDYTWAVDVYSFALIVYAVLVGQPAFPLTLAPTALVEDVVMDDRPPLPVDKDATVKTIVERGWSVDATMRPSFDEIFSVPELIEFKLNPGVDPARVHDFMSLVGCGSGASVANVFGERRPGNAPADTVVDAASRELSMFLLVDWELAVDRRESPCVL